MICLGWISTLGVETCCRRFAQGSKSQWLLVLFPLPGSRPSHLQLGSASSSCPVHTLRIPPPIIPPSLLKYESLHPRSFRHHFSTQTTCSRSPTCSFYSCRSLPLLCPHSFLYHICLNHVVRRLCMLGSVIFPIDTRQFIPGHAITRAHRHRHSLSALGPLDTQPAPGLQVVFFVLSQLQSSQTREQLT